MRFASIAAGSASEMECQIEIARDLEYLGDEIAGRLLIRVREVRRMLQGFLRAGRQPTREARR